MKKNTPKRRLASTRNMSKQDKRRVQLHKTTKNKTEQKTRSGRVMFSRPDDSTLFVRGNRSEASVKTPLNKRLIALVLAVVMILALIPAGIFMLRPKAATTPMGETPMTVRINGVDKGTATIDPGDIETNIEAGNIDYGSVSIPSDAEFVKAVIVSDNNIETEIYSVSSQGDTNYYSISKDAYTGVAKDDDETLVLIFANKYYVNFGTATLNASGYWESTDGTFTATVTPEVNADTNETKYFVYGGEDLEIKEITAKTDRTVSAVDYTSGTNSGTEQIKNSMVTIPSSMYAGNISVNVKFNTNDTYTVQDARYMSNSVYYAKYKGLDNHGGTAQRLDKQITTNSLNSVNKGETATFYVFTQKNTTNQHAWELSMLSINGVDLKFPYKTGEANYVETPFKDGRNIKVVYESNTYKFPKNSSEESSGSYSDGPRTVYRIEVPDVHENLEVNYYVTDTLERTLIVKGLNGINKTAASVENKVLTGNLVGKWYTYTTSSLNVYEAFYDSRTNYPADNLVLYTVKPGYNPYAITTTMYVDGDDATDSIRATEKTGTPVKVIAQASNSTGGNFNTKWRYWGSNDGELLNTDSKKWGDELLLTTLSKDKTNTWYAVALGQSVKKNQQLVLNAPEYKYSVEVKLDGGDLTDNNRYVTDTSSAIMTEKYTHTVADSSPYTFLPAGTPTKDGYVFAGYRMLDINDEYVSADVYMPSDRIDLDTTALSNAYGNSADSTNEEILKLRFIALWKQGKDSTTVNVVTSYQNGVDSNGNALYSDETSITENSAVGEAAVIDDHVVVSGVALSESPYYALSDDSNITLSTTKIGSNDFTIKYDFQLYDLTVENTVLGYPKTKNFPVTVTLTPNEDTPVTAEMESILLNASNGTANISVKNGAVIFEQTLKDQEYFTIPVPYGWDYVISVPEVENDYTNEIEPDSFGTIKTNKTITVTEIVDNSVMGTYKTISGPDDNGNYTITLDSWATGQSFSKPKKVTTPLDIALVVDQSGSMGNADMNPKYAATEKTAWTASEAVDGSTTYYYRTGTDPNYTYYPVQAETGDYYTEAGAIYCKKVVGAGHSTTVRLISLDPGSTPHYNVPTDYYYPDSSGVMHKVFAIVVGSDAHYCVFFYYYVDNNDTYAKKSEWAKSDASAWGGIDYPTSKLTDDSTWNTIVKANKIKLIPATATSGGLDYSTDNLVHYGYSWGSLLDFAYTTDIPNLYKKTQTSVPTRLYYIDDSGEKQYLSTKTSISSTEIAYSGELYYVTSGTKRIKALQEAVTEFVSNVADNAKETGANHRISIIGFAGNEKPGLSRSDGVFNYSGKNYAYDYVNTGMFVNGEFKNYQEITSFTSVSSSSLYTNGHYYIDYYGDGNESTYQPIVMIDGTWYRIDKDAGKYYSVTPSNYNCYDSTATYKDLSSYYSNAYVDVADSDGNVNSVVTDTIAQFGYYGGTYTSYGMAMANQVFDNNSASGRNRIVVVFTDGEPGANGFDESIAGEAKSDGQISKSTYGASVYTVGLFVGKPSSDTNVFMDELSSNKTISKNNVYSASLDTSKIYYYYDSSTDKTYAVSTTYDSKSTLGWWCYVNGAWTHVYHTDDDTTDTSVNHYQFYSKSTNIFGIVSYSAVDIEKIDTSATYYIKIGSTYYEINYIYKWYDSDGYIVEPKSSSSSSGYQFFEFGTTTKNTDGVEYYQSASNPVALKNIFSSISESITTNMTNITLNDQNVMMQDIITDNFDSSAANVVVEKVRATMSNGEVTEKEGGSKDPITDDVTIKFSKSAEDASTITVTGFNYGSDDNYISETHDGYLMRTTISGLKPKTTGFDIPSNENDSGVFEVLYPDDDYTKSPTGETKSLAQFEIPEVNRPTYTLKVDGDDRTTDYTVQFNVYDKNGDPVTEAFTQDVLLDGKLGSISFSRGTGTWTTANANSDDQVIVFENLPDGYTVKAVTSKNSAYTTYDYSLKIEDEDGKTLVTPDPIIGAEAKLPQNGSVIHISSTRHTVDVTLREQTLQTDGTTGGNADPDKYFDIVLTLTREDGSTLGAAVTYSGIEFDEEGVATVQMKHDQVRTLDLPEGFWLAIDVNPDTQDLYLDTYTKGTTINDGAAYGTDEYPATVIVNGQYITIFNKIDFPLPTGMFDSKVPVSVILLAVAGVLGLVAAGAYVYRRKRRLNDR